MSVYLQDNNKYRIMLVPDTMGWILGTWAREIVKWNSDKYDFLIFPVGEIREDMQMFLSLLREVDIIHFLTSRDYISFRDIIKKSGISGLTLISSIHHIVEVSRIESAIHADKIMVVCRKYMDELIKYGVPKEKITLIYNGVDTDVYSPKDKLQSRKRLGIATKVFTIGFSAKASSNHDERKGIDIFLKVLSKLSSSENLDIQVVLTGIGWKTLIKKYSLNKIRINSFDYLPVEKMADYFNSLDVYLVTSRIEGGPVPLLEAMSCGVPVVTTPVGTAIDIIKDKINGLMFPIDNVDSCAEAVQRIFTNRGLAERIGLAGRKTIVENMQWKDTISKIDSLYGMPAKKENRFADNGRIQSFSTLNARLIQRDIKRFRKSFIHKGISCKIHNALVRLTRFLIKPRRQLKNPVKGEFCI